jgi:EAL and modified HD-GYP domain-containing signal transduction protein
MNDTRPTATSAPVDTGSLNPRDVVRRIQAENVVEKRTTEDDLRERFFMRSPVMGRDMALAGYEFSLRAPVSGPDASEVLSAMDAVALSIGLQSLEADGMTAKNLTFVRVSTGWLDTDALGNFPKKNVVLMLQAQTEPPPRALLDALAAQERVWGLDIDSHDPARAGMLRGAAYVRLPTHAHDALATRDALADMARQGAGKFMATGADTDEIFTACGNLGFHFIQGEAYRRINPRAPSRMTSDRLRVMNLLNQVMEDTEIPQLEAAFKLDANITLRLLRYINSPGVGLPRQINSIAHAIVMLGRDQLFRWLTLLLYASGKPSAQDITLLKQALVRAKLMELLAQKSLTRADAEAAFLAGMLSLVDALFNLPLRDAVAQIRVKPEVLQAVVTHSGPIGGLLELAKACESDDGATIKNLLAASLIGADDLNVAHLQALIFAEQIDL